MERSRPKVAGTAMFVLGLGLLGAVMGGSSDRPLLAIGGALGTIFGVGMLVSLLWSFTIDVDKEGLTLRHRGVTTRLGWDSVVVLSVERSSEEHWRHPTLWLHVVPGVRIKRFSATDRDGHRAYSLIDLEDLTHPPELAIALLKVQRADKVDAEDYLSHMAAKRLVSELLREARTEDDHP